jgi:hypothetical protein
MYGENLKSHYATEKVGFTRLCAVALERIDPSVKRYVIDQEPV